MVWVVLTLIALVVSGILLGVLGGVGGIGILVALNGFSESQATPFLACFVLFVLATNVGVVSLINRFVAQKWFAEAAVPWWIIILLSISTMMTWLICIAGFVLVSAI